MKSFPSILILFAHPALEKSRVNARLIDAVGDVEGVTLHDLYEAYPDFDIGVAREQRLLETHDLIVLQHPFYWYSVPALVKEWQDLVLEHGWAYGHEGKALAGKSFLSVITTGGSEESYRHDGMNHFTMREFLAPFIQTARLCGMNWLPPFVVHGTHLLGEKEISRHAADYRRILEALRDGRVDLEAAARHARLNERLEEIIKTSEGPS